MLFFVVVFVFVTPRLIPLSSPHLYVAHLILFLVMSPNASSVSSSSSLRSYMTQLIFTSSHFNSSQPLAVHFFLTDPYLALMFLTSLSTTLAHPNFTHYPSLHSLHLISILTPDPDSHRLILTHLTSPTLPHLSHLSSSFTSFLILIHSPHLILTSHPDS